MSQFFPPNLRKFLMGTPWGEVFPQKANPLPLAFDGRTAALRILREYVSELTFFRRMGPTLPPQPFQVPKAQFHIEWPDSTADMVFPSIAVVHSRADYDTIGLVSYIEEDTRDLYAPGTVLQWQSEYVETINLEIWASKKSERRAILAGMETAFSPVEQMSGLRFQMQEYFNELVVFTLMRREVMDEPDAARNRRRAQLEMQMRFNIVRLVNVQNFSPVLKINTDVDRDTGVPVDLAPDPNAAAEGDLAALIEEERLDTPPNPFFDQPVSSYTGGGPLKRG